MIFIAGSAISVFLAALLALKRKKHPADRILMIWMLVNSAHQLLFYFDISGISAQYPFLAGLNIPFPFLHGPLLFLYVSAFGNRLPKRKIVYVLHCLPFITSYIFFLQFYLMPPEQKLYNLSHSLTELSRLNEINYFAVLASGSVYIPLSMIFLFNYQKYIKEKYSSLGKINLRWLQVLILGMAFIWILVYFGNLKLIFILVGVNTTLTGIFGIRQTTIFTNIVTIWPEGTIETAAISDQVRYEKSGLTPERKLHIAEGLHRLMTEEKIFIDSNLSLDILASELNIHPNYLSQYINQELKLSFYDYINLYRISEFKRIIRHPSNSNYNLLALALDCGFNSKSSFNRNFKKATGNTPSEYIRNIAKTEKQL
jgi:AraC-like DNA-binding protein